MKESLKTTGLFIVLLFVIVLVGGGIIFFVNYDGSANEGLFMGSSLAFILAIVAIVFLGPIFLIFALLDSLKRKRHK